MPSPPSQTCCRLQPAALVAAHTPTVSGGPKPRTCRPRRSRNPASPCDVAAGFMETHAAREP